MVQAHSREALLSHLGTLLAGIALGYLLTRFWPAFAQYPVESALIAVLIASVLVLAWASRELLRDLVPFRRPEPPVAAPVRRESNGARPSGLSDGAAGRGRRHRGR